MKITTLCYLIDEDKVLLAAKKKGPRGFGVGKWNGVGGKVEVEEGESIEAGAIREIKEEIGVQVFEKDLTSMGIVTCVYQGSPDWDQEVHLFIVRAWTGTPSESDEMRPQWFLKDHIPFEQMWVDDRHWLPRVLAGQRVKAKFLFDKTGDTIIESSLE